MQGEPLHIMYVFSCALLGVVVLSQGLQGYFYGVGDVTQVGILQWPSRILLIIGAGAFAMPGNDVIGMTNNELLVVGAIFTAVGYSLAWFARRTAVHG